MISKITEDFVKVDLPVNVDFKEDFESAETKILGLRLSANKTDDVILKTYINYLEKNLDGLKAYLDKRYNWKGRKV